MAIRSHHYSLTVSWTGNNGTGTSSYQSYSRSYEVMAADKPVIAGSSDPAFLGDPTRYNPEELLLASIAACHMLWYLHLCSEAGIVVTAYKDAAKGSMTETANGSGRFELVTLYPVVTVSEPSMTARAIALHEKANKLCFIANSVNFPVRHEPSCTAE